MTRQGVLVLVCAILSQWQLTAALMPAALSPPAGFRLSTTAKTNSAKQMYTCDEGVWIKTGSSAELLDSTNAMIGTYKSVYDRKTKRSRMYWNLNNSAGDSVESGYSTSGVEGTPILSQKLATDAVPEFMCEVVSHQGSGDASLISYIVLTQTKGGCPPNPSLCTVDGASVGVPFSGVFQFFSQDTQPPATVPQSIMPRGQVIEGFFVKGKNVYRYDGNAWQQKGIIATIYNVAGGSAIGMFGTIATPDSYGSSLHWKFNDPNGFWLTGKLCAQPVKVSGDGCPWQLMSVTSTGGTPSLVGPYKFVQLTSTRGGEPPANSAGATPGLLWSSPFSGLFWLYTS